MQKIISIVLSFLLIAGMEAMGQDITTRLLTLTAPPPPTVKQVSTTVVGNPGNATYYYWVVAKYASGNANPSAAAIVINAPNTLSVSTYIRVNWDAVAGATGYDVLRTTTASVPNGNCNCAVVTATASTTVNDQGGALGAYTVTSQGAVSSSCNLDNLSSATPVVTCAPYGWTPGGAAGGALTGTYPNPLIANVTTIGTLPYITSSGILGESIISQVTKTGTVDGIGRLIPPAVIGGVNRIIQTQPSTESKRIVIYGSSVAAGVGATSYANSWAGIFTAAMNAKGYTVLNQSIGGNSTANLISRFWTDVAPLVPDFVILCSGFPNDGYNQTTYIDNMHRLIKMIESIGAKPVIFGQYGDNTVDATILPKKLEIYSHFDKTGLLVADMFGSVANQATGYWLPGTYADALHPNDVGHAIMADCIPLTWFDAVVSNVITPKSVIPGSLNLSTGSVSLQPINVTLATAAKSWTVVGWFRDGGVPARAFLSVPNSEGNSIRVRNATGPIDIAQSAGLMIASTANGVVRDWHHIAVTFVGNTSLISLYVDGVLAGTATTTTPVTATGLCLMGRWDTTGLNMIDGSISQVMFYRAALTQWDISQIYSGNVPIRSLEWMSNMEQLPTNGLLRNNADTLIKGTVTDYTEWAGPFAFSINAATQKVLLTPQTPTASTDAGRPYTIWADADYIYVQTAAGTIKRIPLIPF